MCVCVCDFSNNFRSIRKYFGGTGDRAVVLRFCWFMASRRKFGFCRGFRMQMMFDRPSSLGRLITFSKRRIYFLFFSFFQLSSPTRNSRCNKEIFHPSSSIIILFFFSIILDHIIIIFEGKFDERRTYLNSKLEQRDLSSDELRRSSIITEKHNKRQDIFPDDNSFPAQFYAASMRRICLISASPLSLSSLSLSCTQ